jgi:hypothetical protein
MKWNGISDPKIVRTNNFCEVDLILNEDNSIKGLKHTFWADAGEISYDDISGYVGRDIPLPDSPSFNHFIRESTTHEVDLTLPDSDNAPLTLRGK